MKVIYIGNINSNSDLRNFKGPSLASNKMQINLLRALKSKLTDLTVFSVPSYSLFPFDKKIIVSKKDLDFSYLDIESISYLNLPLIKNLTISNNLKRNLSKWIKKNMINNEKIVLLTYNYPSNLKSILKKLSKADNVISICSICCIVCDKNILGSQFKWNHEYMLDDDCFECYILLDF